MKSAPKPTPKRKAPRAVTRDASKPADPSHVAATLDRLTSEFQRALARIGLEGAGSRATARVIQADVAVTHRLLAGMRATGSASERLRLWPGVEGVQTVAAHLAKAADKPANSGPLYLAVEAYARLIREGGGTHARLIRWVRAAETATGKTPSDLNEQLTSRRALTTGASQTLGYGVQTCSFISFVRPIPGRPELIEGCSAWGLLGLRSHGANVCITSQNTQLRQKASQLATEVRWRPLGTPVDGRDGLLTEFSTHPAPITAAEDNDGYIRQMIDPESVRRGAQVDVVLARHWSPDNNPQFLNGPAVWSQIVRMRHPAQRMVMDVYMHRSLLGSVPPSIGAYVWHPALSDDPRKQWHDRLPGSPRIEVLPQDQPPSSNAWDAQPLLTSRLLQLVEWDRSEFVGYRCDERFPLWSAAYYMTFDLAKAPTKPNA